jgi:hypothetical protein
VTAPEIIDVEGYEEIGEGPTTAALARIEPGKLDIIRPIASADVAVAAFEEYAKLRRTVIVGTDKMNIQGREFVTKSGWRKLAVIMGVTLEIKDRHYERDLAGRVAIAEVICRATAPNGRFVDGLGVCDYRERCCPQAYSETCKDKRNKHQHCDEGCSGFIHFSKPQHDIPATASTRAYNRACSDLFGFGEVSAEEVGDKGEPLDPERVDAITVLLNGIEDKQQRTIIKTKFSENFGRPDGLTNGDLPAVEKWLRANGLTLPDAAATDGVPSAAAPARPGSTSGGGEAAGPGVASTNPSGPPPGSPAGDEREPTGSTPAVPPAEAAAAQAGGRSAPPKKPQESNAAQRRTIGAIASALEKAGTIRVGDKKEITAIISNERTTTTTEITYDEAVRMTALLRFIENGDIEVCDDPNDNGVRMLNAKTQKGRDWMRQLGQFLQQEVRTP